MSVDLPQLEKLFLGQLEPDADKTENHVLDKREKALRFVLARTTLNEKHPFKYLDSSNIAHVQAAEPLRLKTPSEYDKSEHRSSLFLEKPLPRSGTPTADIDFTPSFESTGFETDSANSVRAQMNHKERPELQKKKAHLSSKSNHVVLSTNQENLQRQGSEKKISAVARESRVETVGVADKSASGVKKSTSKSQRRSSPNTQRATTWKTHKGRKGKTKKKRKPFILSGKPLSEKVVRTMALVTLSPVLLMTMRKS